MRNRSLKTQSIRICKYNKFYVRGLHDMHDIKAKTAFKYQNVQVSVPFFHAWVQFICTDHL